MNLPWDRTKLLQVHLPPGAAGQRRRPPPPCSAARCRRSPPRHRPQEPGAEGPPSASGRPRCRPSGDQAAASAAPGAPRRNHGEVVPLGVAVELSRGRRQRPREQEVRQRPRHDVLRLRADQLRTEGRLREPPPDPLGGLAVRPDHLPPGVSLSGAVGARTVQHGPVGARQHDGGARWEPLGHLPEAGGRRRSTSGSSLSATNWAPWAPDTSRGVPVSGPEATGTSSRLSVAARVGVQASTGAPGRPADASTTVPSHAPDGEATTSPARSGAESSRCTVSPASIATDAATKHAPAAGPWSADPGAGGDRSTHDQAPAPRASGGRPGRRPRAPAGWRSLQSGRGPPKPGRLQPPRGGRRPRGEARAPTAASARPPGRPGRAPGGRARSPRPRPGVQGRVWRPTENSVQLLVRVPPSFVAEGSRGVHPQTGPHDCTVATSPPEPPRLWTRPRGLGARWRLSRPRTAAPPPCRRGPRPWRRLPAPASRTATSAPSASPAAPSSSTPRARRSVGGLSSRPLGLAPGGLAGTVMGPRCPADPAPNLTASCAGDGAAGRRGAVDDAV